MMKTIFLQKCFGVFFLLVGILAFSDYSFAQKTTETKDAVRFEIRKDVFPGNVRRSSSRILLIYQGGRVGCKTTSYDLRGEKIESNKNICFRLDKKRMKDLNDLAENPDFLGAEDDYSFFNGGVDYGKSLTIIVYKKDADKTIHLTTPRQSENNIALPASITTFLEKIAQIDKNMKVERETDEKTPPQTKILL